MPSYGNQPISLTDSTVLGGAGFELNKAAGRNFVHTGADATARLAAGSKVCLVEAGRALSRDDLLQLTLETAQQALDIDGASDGRFLSLPDAHTDHVLWWRDGADEARILLQTSTHMSAHLSVSATITRADGTTEKVETASPIPWHPALRHFRYSQTTTDLFESYRYLFLAVESALSQRWPKPSSEGEAAWFERCNRELAKLGVDFASFGGPSPDPVKIFSDEQYKSFRCALFHAKIGSGGVWIPGGPAEDRRLVMDAHASIGGYLREVFQHALGAQTHGGGVTIAGVNLMLTSFKDELVLGVTEDDTPVAESDEAASPRGLPVTAMSTTYLGIADSKGFAHEFSAEIAVRDMQSPVVRRCVSWVPDALMTGGGVEFLDVSGFTTFEHRLRWHYSKHWGGLNARFKF